MLFLASKFFGLTYFWKSIFVQQNQNSQPCDTRAARPAAGRALCWQQPLTAEQSQESPEGKWWETGLHFHSPSLCASEQVTLPLPSALWPRSRRHTHKQDGCTLCPELHRVKMSLATSPQSLQPFQDPSFGGSWSVTINWYLQLMFK